MGDGLRERLLALTATAEKLAKSGLVAMFAINVLLLGYYLFYGYQNDFHSDSAVKNLLAQEMYETGQAFPDSWVYVNGDLMTVFGHWFILPLLAVLPNGYSLHAVSGAIFSTLILLGAWWVTGMAIKSRWVRLLCVTIVAGGISAQGAENLFGQVSYGSIFLSACLVLLFCWRFVSATGRASWLWGSLFLLLVTLVSSSNPQRAVATYVLPLLAALCVDAFARLRDSDWRWQPELRRSAIAVLLALLAVVIGVLLHSWALSAGNGIQGAGTARWLTYAGMIRNVTFTFQGALEVFGAVPKAGTLVMSALGVGQAIRLVSGLALVVFIPVAVLWAIKEKRSGLRMFGAFTAASLVLFFFVHMTTSVPDMTSPVFASRYLVPSLFFGVLTLVAWVFSAEYGAKPGQWVGGGLLVVLMTASLWPMHPFSRAWLGRDEVPMLRLARMLESNGLHYGYAAYWNAGVITVFSNSQTKVRQIHLSQGLPIPMRHLSSDRWYRADSWKGPSFLLLTDDEAKLCNWPLLESYVGKPIKTYRYNEYGVYVFSENIAQGLQSWDRSLDRPLLLRPSENSRRTVGKLTHSQQGNAIEAATQGGYLQFGPYISLNKGVYEADFDVEGVGDAAHGFGVVDVTSGNGVAEHAMRGVTGSGRQKIKLRFTLQKNVSGLESRVRSSGVGTLRWYGTDIKRVGDVD